MTTQEDKRKLATILSGDVKGYSRLLAKDQEGTIRTLNSHKELMANLIQQCQGKVIDAPGDNVHAEFPSVMDAVQCAVEIQKGLKNRNDELPEPRRMEFRIGINLGEVSEKEGKVFGDGLNVAARIQLLADAGGICLSGIVYEQIKDKLEFRYEYLGKQIVKNIAEPVRVYQILLDAQAASLVSRWKRTGLNYWKRVHPAIKIILAVAALINAANIYWQLYTKPSHTPVEVTSKEMMALQLPDKPSIAVLPFTNMSKDPKQEFFSDGLTEEIINGLSKIPQIFVIARNSTFLYKGKTVDIKQVGREMGVQYVMEGSVRREGNRLRITAQLIDATTGRHIFSERYDRALKDIFATQDEITIKVLTALQVALTEGEYARFKARGVSNVEAYFKLLEAWDVFQQINKENNARVRKLAEEAVSLEPGSSRAYAIIAMTHFWDYWLDPAKPPDESVAQGIEIAQKSITLDKNNSYAHGVLAMLYVNKGEYDRAVEEAEVAASLDNGALTNLGSTLMHACRFTEAITVLEKALRLNPLRPHSSCLMNLAISHSMIGQYDQAVQYNKRLLQSQPDHFIGNLSLTVTYSKMGRMEDARKQAAEVLRINPKFSLERLTKVMRYKNPVYTEHWIKALRDAGLT
jgi:adenylate cyclase